MLSLKRWTIVLFALGMLAGCGDQPAETIYQHLEAAVELEAPFEQQQEPLQKAELRENDIFDEIIALGLSDIDEIIRLSDEAIASVEARKAMIAKEKGSLEESFAEFRKIEEVIENLNEESLVSMIRNLEESMEKRYESYHELHEIYLVATTGDRDLFEMLKTEDLSLDDLQAQIDKVNELYVRVENHKEDFNQSTKQYNQLKRDFYEAAGLNVQYE